MLVDTVSYVGDLTEGELVAIAKFFMSHVTPQALQICVDESINHRNLLRSNSTRRASTSDDMDVEIEGEEDDLKDVEFPQTPIEKVLSVIVCAPQNSLFLMQAARRFTTDELVILMQYLLRWLKFYKDNSPVSSLGHSNISVPAPTAIVSWTSTLVDAQLSQMLYAKECRQLVLDLQAAVRDLLQLWDAMESLRGCLAHFHTRGGVYRRENTDYTIETLT